MLLAGALLVGFLAAAAPPAAAASSLDVASDTLWEGTVGVVDEVRVLEGATLLIRPGTTVRFSADKDAGGQPAARLVVAGTLIAQGTADEPIVFTSIGPGPDDWGGIRVESALARASRLRNVRVEHAGVAVSGSQGHLMVEESSLQDNGRPLHVGKDLRGKILLSRLTENRLDAFVEPEATFAIERCELPGASGASPTVGGSGVGGKAVFDGKPAGGVWVHAYPDAAGALRGEGAAFAPTARDGSFFLHLDPGTYFLVAKGPNSGFPQDEPGAGALFGYYGGNPVTVGPGLKPTANVQLVRRGATTIAAGGSEGTIRVEGLVLGPKGPVPGAAVHVYADASRQFRGPDLFGPQGAVTGGTDEQGAFAIDLPPGAYYLVASKRMAGDTLGPLRPGDLHGYFDGNPLAPPPGTKTAVTIQVVEKLRDTVAPPAASGTTAIRGRVLDPEGNVPPGVYAFATTDPSFMIGAMPPFRSQPLAADGSFTIDVPPGNTYYVSARSGYGGPPLPGEWHGFHGGQTPKPVVVEANRVTTGIDFVVRKME